MPNSSTYKSVKKTLATTLSTVCNWEHPTILDSTWTVKVWPHSQNNGWTKASTKKAILNKDFRQAVNFAFDRKSYAAQVSGTDAAENTLRAPWCHQLMSKSMEKILVKLLKNNWLPMAINGRVWIWTMAKQASTTQKKLKLHLRKPKLNCKNKGFNSQFILDYIVSQSGQ